MIDSSPIGRVVAALERRSKTAIADADLDATAVLVPVFVHDGDLGAIFVRRSHEVSTHKGEYCFPGGHSEPGDASLQHTALRELREEIGVRPEDVTVLGELDDVLTINRVRISPFVGHVPYPYPFVLDAREVDLVVPLSLERLIEPGVRSVEPWPARGPEATAGRQLTFYRLEGHVIWGATARILDQFLRAIGLLAPVQ
ncbi:MAG: CoA pyrophosphatase [Cyanobacteria bacterium REEB65]|nr:CoA pyrophosphatase [Cyanobacteria bacterium REEB65]